jgi:predicted DNA-binding transcriptional regulator AlpA
MAESNPTRALIRRTAVSPRGLSRVDAANYVGISPSIFDQMVKDGRMPAPKRVNARRIWDIRQLDDSFEALPADEVYDHDPFEVVSI